MKVVQYWPYFSMKLRLKRILERLVLKKYAECTSQHVKWTSGARVMIFLIFAFFVPVCVPCFSLFFPICVPCVSLFFPICPYLCSLFFNIFIYIYFSQFLFPVLPVFPIFPYLSSLGFHICSIFSPISVPYFSVFFFF